MNAIKVRNCLFLLKIDKKIDKSDFYWYIEPIKIKTGHESCLHDKELRTLYLANISMTDS